MTPIMIKVVCEGPEGTDSSSVPDSSSVNIITYTLNSSKVKLELLMSTVLVNQYKNKILSSNLAHK